MLSGGMAGNYSLRDNNEKMKFSLKTELRSYHVLVAIMYYIAILNNSKILLRLFAFH